MRRSDREIKDFQAILAVIDRCEVLRLGMTDGGEAYIVPLNFGFEAMDGDVCFYIHSALTGRKIDILRRHSQVFVELDIPLGVVRHGPGDCATGYAFQSVMGEGTAEFLSGPDKIRGLERVMAHMTMRPGDLGGTFHFDPEAVERTAVLRVTVKQENLRGKQAHVAPQPDIHTNLE